MSSPSQSSPVEAKDGAGGEISIHHQNAPHLNLFLESMDMATASVSAYALMDVRRVVKKHLRQHKHSSHKHEQNKEDILSLEDCQKLLSLPMTALEFFEFWDKNSAVLEQSMLSALAQFGSPLSHEPSSYIKTRDFVKVIVQPYAAVLQETDGYYSWEEALRNRTIHHVHDEHAYSECVYYIITDQAHKRIILVFRGSATRKDWVQDLQLVMSPIPNPVLNLDHNEEEEEEIPETLGIHLGFRDYLYSKNLVATTSESSSILPTLKLPSLRHMPSLPSVPSLGLLRGESSVMSSRENNAMPAAILGESVSRSDEIPPFSPPAASDESNEEDTEKAADSESTRETPPLCKMETIREELYALKKKHPDYRIYVSGHSLGGALGIIAAMEVAADPILCPAKSPPVTVITIGTPRAGGKEFADAIEHLEKRGKLRCLCIHNHGDVVPLVQSNPMKLINSNRGFVHVGFKALLYGKGRFELGRANHRTPLISQRHKLHKHKANVNNNDSIGQSVWHLMFGRKDSSASEEDGNSNTGKLERSDSFSANFESAWFEPEGPEEEEEPNGDTTDSARTQEHPQHSLFETTDSPPTQEHSLFAQMKLQKINLHDYREYVERLLELQPILDDLTIEELYERHRAKESSS